MNCLSQIILFQSSSQFYFSSFFQICISTFQRPGHRISFKNQNIFQLGVTMEKGNINVIIFDEDEPSIKDHRDSRTVMSSKQGAAPNSHHMDIIQQEIAYLTDKIRSLEQQADSLLQIKNDSTSNCRQSNTTIDISPGHHQEIFMTIERKVQIIVRETRKMIDKLGQTFEKKLQARISKKHDESGITKIKENYFNAIRKIEEGYKRQIERINREHKEVEAKMMSRVGAIEQKLLNRMNQYEIKEKEYVDWIHHLEIQLKEKQDKPRSKKMIEVTHAPNQGERVNMRKEKDAHENSSIMTGMTGQNNQEALNIQKSGSQVNQNNNSKIQRRHRIFDTIGAKTSSSVSPNAKVVSPINAMHAQPNQHSSKLINPVSKQPVMRQSEPYPVERPGLVIDRMTEPLKNNFTNEGESSPWRAMDRSEDKVEGTRRNQVLKDQSADEFYKDLPKASGGWERFQDYQENQQSSSDSEEDVVFYRNEQKSEDEVYESELNSKWKNSGHSDNFKPAKKPQPKKEQSVFSPFDLN